MRPAGCPPDCPCRSSRQPRPSCGASPAVWPGKPRSGTGFAGALERRLNGPNHYGGVLVDKPWLGADFPPVTRPDIIRACRLMLGASTLAALLAVWLRLAWLCR